MNGIKQFYHQSSFLEIKFQGKNNLVSNYYVDYFQAGLHFSYCCVLWELINFSYTRVFLSFFLDAASVTLDLLHFFLFFIAARLSVQPK